MCQQIHSKSVAGAGDIETTHAYDGLGTTEDPFVVEFHEGDSANPMNWSLFRKWEITAIVTLSVFAVTFTSSAYSESSIELMQDLNMGSEIFILGLSLFVLGFAIGPALWGPLVGIFSSSFVSYFGRFQANSSWCCSKSPVSDIILQCTDVMC
jgi:hypothetical protein